MTKPRDAEFKPSSRQPPRWWSFVSTLSGAALPTWPLRRPPKVFAGLFDRRQNGGTGETSQQEQAGKKPRLKSDLQPGRKAG